MTDKCNNKYKTLHGATLICEREIGHEGSHLQRDKDWFGVWTDNEVQIFIFKPQDDAAQSP